MSEGSSEELSDSLSSVTSGKYPYDIVNYKPGFHIIVMRYRYCWLSKTFYRAQISMYT